MRDWLFLGSSSNAVEHYATACQRFGPWRSITTNRGIRLMRRPNFYFRVDQEILADLPPLIADARASGTVTITLDGYNQTLADYDIHLKTPRHDPPRHGRYGAFVLSGLTCLQIACMFGAKLVILCGCEGYRPGKPVHWGDDGRQRTDRKCQQSNERIEAETQRIVDAWSDVTFICMGHPCYMINAENWEEILA